jgi:flavin reductase (DIM6/NTAB) family NADH-FMN oxidoreductase RutF
MQEFPLSKAYQLIEPGPVVLLSTASGGRANVMTMSWHMMMEFTPPLIGCVVSSANFSAMALKETGECVIAIPSVGLAETVVGIGNCSGRDTDKFSRFGLTASPASAVAPPLIGQCFANLECRVADTGFAGRYDFYVLEVVRAWRDPGQPEPKYIHHKGYGLFSVDGEDIRLESGMP